MKRCSRCKIVFHLNDRTRCLYCESILLEISGEDLAQMQKTVNIGGNQPVQPILRHILKNYQSENLAAIQLIMGNYFRARTFHFMYAFCRNEFKMGQAYKRFWIQPLNITSFLMVPWVVFNFFDSIFFRAIYAGFCPKCGWKYKREGYATGHNADQCEYNREYKALMDDIMNGRIAKTEMEFKRVAFKKEKAKQRSCYNELCAPKNPIEGFLDIFCIWFSICVLIVICVALTFPLLIKWAKMLQLGDA